MNPYEELANAIVLEAVKDYRLHDDERELASIARFFRSGWFEMLSNLDGETLLRQVQAMEVR